MKRSRQAALAASAVATVCAAVVIAPPIASGAGVPDEAPPAAVATDTLAVTHAQNVRVPEGASWTQHYFPSADGVDLHADVLLPEGLAPGAKVPVVLSVGPYFSHAGDINPFDFPTTGPSPRHQDLVEQGGLLDRGYALVRVDLRGTGGSSGCHDFLGPGEQADVAAAIDWAGSQPWSTGAVGMYGMSYEATTALVGNNLAQDGRHEALKAVVAEEPLWDPYANFQSDGVPRTNVMNFATTFVGISTLPQLPDDDERYRTNADWELSDPTCLTDIFRDYKTANQDSQHWQDRDLLGQSEGSDTPLFFSQGFLEWNTEAQSVQTYLENHEGPERGWIGPWDHVEGDAVAEDGRLERGREGWYEEIFAFYDEHLKGVAPATSAPAFSVQDSTGTWRSQDEWPVVDREASVELGGGSYVDDGEGSAFVRSSEPVEDTVRITGTPRVTLQAQGSGDVMVRLHDIRPDGSSVQFDQQVAALDTGETTLELRSTDWVLPAGHRLAVEIGTIQLGPDFTVDDWIPTTSGEEIAVSQARLDLELDDPSDDVATAGERAVYLDEYLAQFTGQVTAGDASFALPATDD